MTAPIFGVSYDAISKDEENEGKNLEMRLDEQREWLADAENTVKGRRLVILPGYWFSDNDVPRSRHRRETQKLLGRDAAMRALEAGYTAPHPPEPPWCEPSSDGPCHVRHPLEILLSSEESRISRETEWCPEPRKIANRRPFWGVQITGNDELYDLTDPESYDDFVQAIHDSQKDNTKHGKRVKRGTKKSAARGNWSGGGSPAFGFEYETFARPNGKTGYRWTGRLDQRHVEFLRLAAKRFLASDDGKELVTICQDGNDDGIRTVRGNLLTPGMLKRVLLAPYVIGVRRHQPTKMVERKPVPDGEPVDYPAKWPPMLDDDRQKAKKIQDDLKAILNDPARRTNHGSRTRVHLLAGLATCALCGKKMVGRYDRYGRRTLLCLKGPPYFGCGKVGRQAEPIERQVRRVVCRVLDEGPFKAALAGAQSDDDAESKLWTDQRADQALLDNLDDALTLAKARGDRREQDSIIRVRAPIEDRMERRGHELQSWQAKRARRQVSERDEELRQSFGIAENQVLEPRSVDWQHAVIASVIEKIRIHPVGGGRRPFDWDAIEILWQDEWDPTRTAAIWQDVVGPPHPQHGERRFYRQGCRCELCTEANRLYHREYYPRKLRKRLGLTGEYRPYRRRS